MNTAELRQLSPDALMAQAQELRQQIHTARFQRVQQREKNVRRVGQLRRTLARVLTLLSERAHTPSSSVPTP